MKHLIALFFLFSLNAEASYFANHCSDSYGSVRWETGHNSNQLFYKIGEEVVKKVDFHKLEVKFDKEMVPDGTPAKYLTKDSFSDVCSVELPFTSDAIVENETGPLPAIGIS